MLPNYYIPHFELLDIRNVSIYRTKARTAPPKTANEPLARLAMAAPVEVAAAGAEAVREELLLVVVGRRLPEVERVPLEAAVGAVLEVTVRTVVELVEADEVVLTEVLVGEAVDEVTGDTWTVLVETGPLAEELVLLLPLVLPVMWNGKDHWKIVGSESQEIWMP